MNGGQAMAQRGTHVEYPSERQAPIKTPGSIASHRKTRSGCKQCKRRKIKCDETRPSCLKCVKHSIQCDITPIQTHTPISSPSSGAAHLLHEGASDNADFSMLDLELLHHFTTSTYSTLSIDPIIQVLWQRAIPQLGFESRYVMHGILAIAALHHAKTRREPVDSLVAHGLAHYAKAIGLARPAVAHISTENATQVYAFSMVAVIIAMASPPNDGDFLLVENEAIAEWLYLLRGTLSIVTETHEALHAGVLGPMFRIGSKRARERETIMEKNLHLQGVETHVQNTVFDRSVRETYLTSISKLHKTLAGRFDIQLGISEATDILHWPIQVPRDYLTYLGQCRSEALVILAFFCVALHSTQKVWWFEGCSYRLMGRIYGLLGEEYRHLIQWPIAEIGWTPG